MTVNDVARAVMQINRWANEPDPIGDYYGCSGLAAEATERQRRKAMRELFAQAGMSPEQFNAELARNVSERWMWKMGLWVDSEDLAELRIHRCAW